MRNDTSIALRIAGYAALILFFELALIRYTAGYVRVFGFYLNFVLIATFLGMGVGLLRADRAEKLKWMALPASLLLFGAVWYFARTPIAVPADPDEFVWGIFGGQGGRELPLSLVVAALFALTALFFVPLGALLGQQFRKLPALRAYAFDIGGSLTGILAFGVLSAVRQPPVVWLAVGFAVWLLFSLGDRLYAVGLLVVSALVLGLVGSMSGGKTEFWSPYYRINVRADDPAIRLDVNGSLHQFVLDLDSARASRDAAISFHISG